MRFSQLISQKNVWGVNCEIQGVSMVMPASKPVYRRLGKLFFKKVGIHLMAGTGVGGTWGSLTAGCLLARDIQTLYCQEMQHPLSCSRRTKIAQHLHDSTVSLRRRQTTLNRHAKSTQKPFPPNSFPPSKASRTKQKRHYYPLLQNKTWR